MICSCQHEQDGDSCERLSQMHTLQMLRACACMTAVLQGAVKDICHIWASMIPAGA